MDKKPPMRTCIACRANKPKKELIRIVKTPDGIMLDRTGKAQGRGAYVCNDRACIEKLKKVKALSRAFSCEVDASVYDRIQKEFDGNEE